FCRGGGKHRVDRGGIRHVAMAYHDPPDGRGQRLGPLLPPVTPVGKKEVPPLGLPRFRDPPPKPPVCCDPPGQAAFACHQPSGFRHKVLIVPVNRPAASYGTACRGPQGAASDSALSVLRTPRVNPSC